MEIKKKRLIEDIKLFNEDIDAKKLEVFDIDQLKVIEEMLMFGVDMIDFFSVNLYTPDQMSEILDAVRLGLDYDVLLNQNMNGLQLRILKYGLQMGIDISKYNDYRFDWDQMYQIYYGLVSGIDVSSYADYNIPVLDMIKIRKQLMAA